MSLRKFMHPRNRYKKVPDFKQLAVHYPEFRKVAITDLTGKVKIDFKNEQSLRVLTEILLKHDFNLEVKIPPNKLVPTLPLRLNYILWIEDVMKHASFADMEDIMGIDIGTGAVCIYPLLFAKMCGTHMTGTEVDETSVSTAVQQVENNDLQHLIKVLKVSGETILKGIIGEQTSYHFSMCNPPFFEAEESSEKVVKKLPPRNAPTGNEGELTIDGGERKFVTKMIEESFDLRDKVKIYTTMLGRKTNLLVLVKLLKRQKIENLTWTEFCQGHTKRWGLAWTFLPKTEVDLTTAPVIRKTGDFVLKLLNDQRPVEILFPMQEHFTSFDHVVNVLRETMNELNIKIRNLDMPIEDFEGWSCQLTAEKDTWSHARRKRRLAQRQIEESCEKQSTKNVSTTNDSKDALETAEAITGTETTDNGEVQSSTISTNSKESLLVCSLFLEVTEDEEKPDQNCAKISMTLDGGSGGKNALETFRQYLINKLGIREYFQNQSNRLNKKRRKRLKKNISDPSASNTDQTHNTCLNSSIETSTESS